MTPTADELAYHEGQDHADALAAAEEAEERRRNEQMEREYGHIAKLTRAECYALMAPYWMDRCEPSHVHPVAREVLGGAA